MTRNPIPKGAPDASLRRGASGAIGTRLVTQLIDRGHEVIGTVNTKANIERVSGLGAKAITLDLLDAPAVRRAVLEAEPDAIMHEATALAKVRFGRNPVDHLC